jgi:hypothetical protein
MPANLWSVWNCKKNSRTARGFRQKTGIDFLLTSNGGNRKYAGLQVKFSKDYRPEMGAKYFERFSACGWFKLSPEKIKKSPADIWLLGVQNSERRKLSLIAIAPSKLFKLLASIQKNAKSFAVYLWITKDGRHCFEGREIKGGAKTKLLSGNIEDIKATIKTEQDFSAFLDYKTIIETKLKTA